MNGSIYVMNWRNRTRLKLILYKGGKCIKCGYGKHQYPRAFHFHHRDPKEKEFNLGSKGLCRNYESLQKEADKCDLMCCRCHAELHDEFVRQSREERLKIKRFILRNKPCSFCGKEFKPVTKKIKCCSVKCSRLFSRKVERPSKDDLKSMIETMSWKAIGRKFEVSDNGVRKWAKGYGLI